MRLEAGTTAPDFQATTVTGENISLSDFQGERVWISFFRYAACPLCCFRVHELMSQWEQKFRPHSVHLLTVWQSKPEKLQEVLDRYAPPFPLIADPKMDLYRQYQVEKGLLKVFGKEVLSGVVGARKTKIPIVRAWEGPATRSPADFLVGADGVIDVSFYGENVGQMIPFVDVLSWLESDQPARTGGAS